MIVERPAAIVGSALITIVGPLDPAALEADLDPRLRAHGVVAEVRTAPDVSPRLDAPDDRLAEIWVIASTTELRVVITEPTHAHVVVHALPPGPASLPDAAVAIEDGVAMALAEAWPAPITNPVPQAWADPALEPLGGQTPFAKPKKTRKR